MANAYDGFNRAGQGAEYFGYGVSGTMTKGTHENKSASLSSGAAKVGGADEPLLGVIANIEGTECSIQRRGYATVTYSGTAPTAGAYNKLECGASGSVVIDGTNGIPFYVDSVDTDASTCVVWLG